MSGVYLRRWGFQRQLAAEEASTGSLVLAVAVLGILALGVYGLMREL